MGFFATHSVVFARLIINDKSYGMQPFLVQIRDRESLNPISGCEMGDIGPKFGFNPKNNAYLILKNLKVPRNALLSRYVEVTPEGQFKKKGDLRILYSIMTRTRIQLILTSYVSLSKAITIATRYSTIRR